MKRKLIPGDVLIRYLMPFSVWHYGIVIQVGEQNLDDILLLEFADGDKVTRVTLREFMYGRIYFWIDDFDYEMKVYGAEVFYPRKERLARAIKIAEINGMTYSINKYNCEYFVRKCVFKNRNLWISGQTSAIGETKFSVYSKIFLIFVYGMAKNHVDSSRWESRLDPTKFKYVVCVNCGGIHNHEGTAEYDYLKCKCKTMIKLH